MQLLAILYEYKDGKTRVPISVTETIMKEHPAVLKEIEVKRTKDVPTYLIHDETGKAVNEFRSVDRVLDFLNSVKSP